MKLRIQEKSITLRLQNEELSLLEDRKKLSQRTSWLNFHIQVEIEVKNTDEISMSLNDNLFSFSIPEKNLRELGNKHKVGFNRTSGETELIIEKDLPSNRYLIDKNKKAGD